MAPASCTTPGGKRARQPMGRRPSTANAGGSQQPPGDEEQGGGRPSRHREGLWPLLSEPLGPRAGSGVGARKDREGGVSLLGSCPPRATTSPFPHPCSLAHRLSASTAQPRNLSRASPPRAQQAPLAAGIWTSQGGIPLSGLWGVQHGWLRGWLLEPQFCPRVVLLTVHSQPLPVAPQPHPVQCAPLWRDHPRPGGRGWVPPHTRSAWGLHLLLGGASHWDGCFLVVQQRK